MGSQKDKKALIALAAGTLVAGMVGTPAVSAMSDFADLGSGAQIREQLLQAEAKAPVGTTLAGCKDGKCPRPKRPEEGKRKSGQRWNTITAKSEEGKCGVGTCGGGDSDTDDTDDSDEATPKKKDKTSEGKCGEGTCG